MEKIYHIFPRRARLPPLTGEAYLGRIDIRPQGREGSATKTEKSRKILSAIAFLLVLAVTVSLTAAVLRPRHVSYGSNWDVYVKEPKNSIDVLYMGGSAAYGGWNPAVIYAESGLTGYVMAGSMQPASVTYWYLCEALKTQSPSLVMLEGKSLLYGEYTDYMELNIHYMPWGIERIMATVEGAPCEDWLNLFFDLYTNHERWKELTPGDFKKVLVPPNASPNKGYTALGGVIPQGTEPDVDPMPISEAQYQTNLNYFKRIVDLCEKEGIDLIVTINPTFRQFTDEVFDRVEADVLAMSPHIRFLNWADAFSEMGLEPEQHLYDLGHLNVEGAKLFSAYTGAYLKSLGYAPREQAEENRRAWQEAAEYWKTR